MKNGAFLTLGIESSCDDTAAAVVADGRTVLSNAISSQIKVHEVFGGVVPEIASRHHLNNIDKVLDKALADAEVTLDDIDLIGVTRGPGLIGALLVGVSAAKAISFARDIPLVGVHHIQGHICANYAADPELEPPLLAVVVSGGHTSLIMAESYTRYKVLGSTRDDAAGEALDKIARVLGLGYPGGPKIDKLSKTGNPHAVEFKRVMLEKDSLDFSFSGLKTGVLNYINSEKQAGRGINEGDIAASFQKAIMDVIVTKTMMAADRYGVDKIAMAGGVSANSLLREMLADSCRATGRTLYCPSPILCTDNGVMPACAAYYRYQAGYRSSLALDATPSLDIAEDNY